jgi:hypothetical protein
VDAGEVRGEPVAEEKVGGAAAVAGEEGLEALERGRLGGVQDEPAVGAPWREQVGGDALW